LFGQLTLPSANVISVAWAITKTENQKIIHTGLHYRFIDFWPDLIGRITHTQFTQSYIHTQKTKKLS